MSSYNPMQHFQKWFYEADGLFDEREPNAMSLSTIGEDGFPRSRMVLLKKYTWEGFIFYTNYNSEKGKAIAHNPSVCLLFNWIKSSRTIQIQGSASKISVSESSNYFQSRPRGSQLGAWASQQSRIVESRTFLEDRLRKFEQEYKGKDIPKPNHWGGYLVKPKTIEFIETEDNSIQKEEIYHLEADYNWSKSINIKLKTI
ncbi:pyridoxamine 5'-phosphate oxidase [Winogradskyella jejuensis]|uniref:Pyridoxamine 5'-phosphate oxidase n=1 Tax=Winogradskyella jejuensis TaxID=1089305 RepID=A0A1M5KPD9_9FLAO|nr:pyridoxamine 5'-phosphate oxidase [Winogradskyella jejuensis]SHG54586.1 Pyridoxamine 5'-phosphate oxidase [Winogradskyella jejuensis]